MTNYQVLARRYRPRQFDEVVGQESVAETLRGGIIHGRVAHAYLFTGPRGVGKTSMARIFAKALNCPEAADRDLPEDEWARPCNTCTVCDAIHCGQDIDVVEMDAASHRGIEDVRGIIENVSRAPARSPYKVFIVDEVHMLTREAFNALLKTVEEPPAHVKFLFATTEPHRIPDTVLSRCQRFDFHPIDETAIARRLQQILEMEGRQAEDGLLHAVARQGRGGLRDAQTLLDQLLTYSDAVLKEEDLERITGRVSEAAMSSLVEALVGRDTHSVLATTRDCFARGADPAVLLQQMVERLQACLYGALEVSPGASQAAAAPEENHRAETSVTEGDVDRLLGALQIVVEAAGRLRISAYPKVAAEIALLKATRLEDGSVLNELIDRLSSGEEIDGGLGPDVVLASRSQARGAGQRFSQRPSAPHTDAPPPAGGPGARAREMPSHEPSASSPPTPQVRPSSSSAQPEARTAGPSRDGGSPQAVSAVDEAVSAEMARVQTTVSVQTVPAETAPETITETVPAELQAAPERFASRVDGEIAPVSAAVEPPPPRSAAPPQAESACGAERLLALWDQIQIELREGAPRVAPLLAGARLDASQLSAGTAVLEISNDFFYQQLRSGASFGVLRDLIRDVTGEPWELRVAKVEEESAVTTSGDVHGSATNGLEVPASSSPSADAANNDRADAGAQVATSVAGAELVEKAKKLFNGRLI